MWTTATWAKERNPHLLLTGVGCNIMRKLTWMCWCKCCKLSCGGFARVAADLTLDECEWSGWVIRLGILASYQALNLWNSTRMCFQYQPKQKVKWDVMQITTTENELTIFFKKLNTVSLAKPGLDYCHTCWIKKSFQYNLFDNVKLAKSLRGEKNTHHTTI